MDLTHLPQSDNISTDPTISSRHTLGLNVPAKSFNWLLEYSYVYQDIMYPTVKYLGPKSIQQSFAFHAWKIARSLFFSPTFMVRNKIVVSSMGNSTPNSLILHNYLYLHLVLKSLQPQDLHKRSIESKIELDHVWLNQIQHR